MSSGSFTGVSPGGVAAVSLDVSVRCHGVTHRPMTEYTVLSEDFNTVPAVALSVMAHKLLRMAHLTRGNADRLPLTRIR